MPASHVIARVVSIVGHPVILISIAALFAASAHGASASQLQTIGMTVAILAAIVLAFSWFQVRSGRWAHVDASARTERPMLNGFLACLLLGSALLLWLLQRDRPVAIALALSAMLVLAALLLARWVKLSLHAAFAAFATSLLWPMVAALIVGALVTAAVAWSRLVLRRHAMADVIVGLVLGTLAGCAFDLWIV